MDEVLRTGSTLQILVRLCSRHRLWLVAVLTWSITWSVFMLVIPYIFQDVVNAIALGQTIPFARLVLLAGAYVLAQEALNVFWRLWDFAKAYLQPRIARDITASTIRTVFDREMQFFEANDAGSLAQKTNDVGTATNILLTIVENVLMRALGTCAAAVALGLHGVGYGAVFFCWAAAFTYLSMRFTLTSSSLAAQSAEQFARQNGNLVDVLSNISTVRNYRTAHSEYARFMSFLDNTVLAQRKVALQNVKSQWILGSLVSLLIAGLLFFLLLHIRRGGATPGEATFVLTLSLNMVWEVWSISNYLVGSSAAIGSLRRAIGTLTQGAKVEIVSFENRTYSSAVSIALDSVSVTFAEKIEALREVTFHVNKGEHVAILGPSGAGKTTLLNVIVGLVSPTSGSRYVMSQQCRDGEGIQHRDDFAVVQDSRLFNRSIRANVVYGNETASESEIADALQRAACEFVYDLPGGLDFDVGPNGERLSTGQRQRVTLARALLNGSSTLILDEPTAHLDSLNATTIKSLFSTVLRASTCVVVTHDIALAAACDRVYLLANGRIICSGSAQTVLASNEYRTMLQDRVQSGHAQAALDSV